MPRPRLRGARLRLRQLASARLGLQTGISGQAIVRRGHSYDPVGRSPSGNRHDVAGHSNGRFQRAISRRHLLAAETAAREMGGLSLAVAGEQRSSALRAGGVVLARAVHRGTAAPLTEVALAASALAELRHGRRNAGVETLKRLLRNS